MSGETARNRISGENAYKNKLSDLNDAYLTNPRDGSSVKIIQHPFGIFNGQTVSVSNFPPEESDGDDGDVWFVIN